MTQTIITGKDTMIKKYRSFFVDLTSKGRTPIGHVHLNRFIDFLHQQTELIHNETNRYQLLENNNVRLETELETGKCENQKFTTELEVIIVSYLIGLEK